MLLLNSSFIALSYLWGLHFLVSLFSTHWQGNHRSATTIHWWDHPVGEFWRLFMLHILFSAAVPCLMQHICWHDYLLKCFPTAFIAFTRRKFGIFQHHGLYIECKYLYIHVHMRESVYYVSYTGSCQNLCRCNQSAICIKSSTPLF